VTTILPRADGRNARRIGYFSGTASKERLARGVRGGNCGLSWPDRCNLSSTLIPIAARPNSSRLREEPWPALHCAQPTWSSPGIVEDTAYYALPSLQTSGQPLPQTKGIIREPRQCYKISWICPVAGETAHAQGCRRWLMNLKPSGALQGRRIVPDGLRAMQKHFPSLTLGTPPHQADWYTSGARVPAVMVVRDGTQGSSPISAPGCTISPGSRLVLPLGSSYGLKKKFNRDS
jgi:hypothetical protein